MTERQKQILIKLASFCAYQERTLKEVRQKLREWEVADEDTEPVVAELIAQNYLNEERYAVAFAGGKFRTKDWGRVKIKYELKQHQISDYCIKKALLTISTEDYNRKLDKLFIAKLKTIKSEKNIYVKKRKMMNYLLQKGYESTLINELVQKI